MVIHPDYGLMRPVSLFTREWIEIAHFNVQEFKCQSPSLRGSGLKYNDVAAVFIAVIVSLFTREWIEIAL